MKTALLLCGSLLVVGSSFGAQIKLQSGLNSNGSNGGAYTAQILPGSGLTNARYSPATKNVGNFDPSFETFCLEKWEYFTPGTTYNFTIDLFASGDRNKDGNADEYDYLSKGSAFLYQKYALGQFNSLVGTTYGSWKLLNKDFQAAIWFLEGDITNPNNYFTSLLVPKFSTLSNAKSNATGNAFGVRVLNPYTTNAQQKTVHAQSQLYYVNDSGSTIALFGAIGVALMALRRRFASAA